MSRTPQPEPVQPNIFRSEPVVNRPPKRLRAERRGQEFAPHGTDSVGVVVSDPRKNRRSVEFFYRHDPDTVHSMRADEFNDRFAYLLERRRDRKVAAKLSVNLAPFAKAMKEAADAVRGFNAELGKPVAA